MADVNVTPRIRCDNCGHTKDKVRPKTAGVGSPIYGKPDNWGSVHIVGGISKGAYGGKDRIDMTDLCPECANAAISGMAKILEERRNENG